MSLTRIRNACVFMLLIASMCFLFMMTKSFYMGLLEVEVHMDFRFMWLISIMNFDLQ